MLTNLKADMAEKAVVMALIIIAAIGAFGALGSAISSRAQSVADAVNG